MVDAMDSKSIGETHAGSSPAAGTIFKKLLQYDYELNPI